MVKVGQKIKHGVLEGCILQARILENGEPETMFIGKSVQGVGVLVPNLRRYVILPIEEYNKLIKA